MYDLIVVGCGPAGSEAALKARELNKSVLLVENHKIGGTCLNYGCIPTKSLLFQTKKLYEMSGLKKYGIIYENLSFDYSKCLDNKNNTVNRLVKGLGYLLKKSGVELIYGFASLETENTIKVNNNIYQASKILLALGAADIVLPIDGFNLAITSREFLEKDLTNVSKVVIIGAGVVGVEIATILSHLKIEVIILEAKEEILLGCDKDAVELLKKDFKRNKIKVITKTNVRKIESNKVYYDDKEVICDFVISCVGRKADLEYFDKNNLLEKEKSFIKVNKNFQTNLKNVYAVGDCIKDIQLAHYARACAINIVNYIYNNKKVYNLNNVARCIYTDKEISMVGEREKSDDIVIKNDLVANPKAVIENTNRGFFKLVFDSEYYLKGATLMCEKSSEMISIFVNALNQKLTYEDIKNNIYPHPSFIENLNKL